MRAINYEVGEALVDTLHRAFWRHDALYRFLRSCGVSEQMLVRDPSRAKAKVVRETFDNLEGLGDAGLDVLRRILTELTLLEEPIEWGLEPDKVADGRDALARLKQIAGRVEAPAREDRRSAAIVAEARAKNAAIPYEQVRIQVHREFLDAHSWEDAQGRGLALEDMLGRLMKAVPLEYRPPYSQEGEQLDGAFVLDYFDHVVEARWRKDAADPSDLSVFKDKVDRRLSSTRGLFVSYAGFSDNAVALRSRRGEPLLLMDGYDLSLVMEGRIQIDEAIRLKTRWAAQTGEPFRHLAHLLSS